MLDDIQVLARGANDFLAHGTIRSLENLASNLRYAVENATSKGTSNFRWKTDGATPIVTSPSRNWKGTTNDFSPIYAEITIDYDCTFLSDCARVRVNEGCTVVCLKEQADPDTDKKEFHFDAGAGGWANQAGHPPLHCQFSGFVKDIPRLPSVIVHPVDVITFVILELHQSRWREHTQKMEVKNKLRRFPERQRTRLRKVATGWATALIDGSDHGLVILQRRAPHPYQL